MRFTPGHFADRDNHYLSLVARLKPGSSLESARGDMKLVSQRLKAQHPKEVDVTVVAFSDLVNAQTRLMLVALFGAALCVLLIACTNLASLLIARSLQRRKELAVRTAIGAGRERLIRQLVTESVVLALGGGSLGIALAYVATPLLGQLAPVTLPIADSAAIDGRVLLFAAVMTFKLASTSAVPAWLSTATAASTDCVKGREAAWADDDVCDRRWSSLRWRSPWCFSSHAAS